MKFKEWRENLPEYAKMCYARKLNEVLEDEDGIFLEFIPVIEYGEQLPVFFDKERNTIVAFNEGGYCSVEIDVETLYEYLKRRFDEND